MGRVGGPGEVRQEGAGRSLLDDQEEEGQQQGLGDRPARPTDRPAPQRDQQDRGQAGPGQEGQRLVGWEEARELEHGDGGGQESREPPGREERQEQGGWRDHEQPPDQPLPVQEPEIPERWCRQDPHLPFAGTILVPARVFPVLPAPSLQRGGGGAARVTWKPGG